MPIYQYKREPLTNENADRLSNACRSGIEKVVISTLLDTGLRVSELAGLTKENILWQDRRLLVYGKGGPFGKTSALTKTDPLLLIRSEPVRETGFSVGGGAAGQAASRMAGFSARAARPSLGARRFTASFGNTIVRHF